MGEFKKLENENFHQYIWRMDELVQSGKYKNWKETKVVIRFWIMSLIFALAGLATLKLR